MHIVINKSLIAQLQMYAVSQGVCIYLIFCTIKQELQSHITHSCKKKMWSLINMSSMIHSYTCCGNS